MALKFRYKSKDEIPAEHAGFYAEREGAWLLDVDGAVDKAKLDESRTTNVALLKERDDLKQRFEGIDPDEVRKLAAEKRQLEEAQQLTAGEVDKVVENRIKGLRADWDKQLGSVTAERDSLNSRLTSIQIDQGVTLAATKRGLRPTAVADITPRARTVFRLVNGAAVAFEGDGKTPRYGKDGITPMSLDEWVDTQVAGNSLAGTHGGSLALREHWGGSDFWSGGFRYRAAWASEAMDQAMDHLAELTGLRVGGRALELDGFGAGAWL